LPRERERVADGLARVGFDDIEDLDGHALDARYFSSRSDGLAIEGLGRFAHIVRAQV
jgi:hypothetical protein